MKGHAMKRLLIIPLLVLSLAACAPLNKVGDIIAAAATTITNPVGTVDIYRVKNGYAAALQLVLDYRNYCWSKPYATLVADTVSKPICQNRRQVVRTAQAAKSTASRAITVADNFIRNNPTGNAATYISAAWGAVQDFQASVPAVK